MIAADNADNHCEREGWEITGRGDAAKNRRGRERRGTNEIPGSKGKSDKSRGN